MVELEVNEVMDKKVELEIDEEDDSDIVMDELDEKVDTNTIIDIEVMVEMVETDTQEMVEQDEYDETQLVTLQTVIEVEVIEVRVETHSMVMVEEVETLDVQVDVDETVETQYADADEMVEMLIDSIIIIEINEVTDDIDI